MWNLFRRRKKTSRELDNINTVFAVAKNFSICREECFRIIARFTEAKNEEEMTQADARMICELSEILTYHMQVEDKILNDFGGQYE